MKRDHISILNSVWSIILYLAWTFAVFALLFGLFLLIYLSHHDLLNQVELIDGVFVAIFLSFVILPFVLRLEVLNKIKNEPNNEPNNLESFIDISACLLSLWAIILGWVS